nr:hypothetical protein [uncultured Pseudokineococcus sp.]
MRRRPLPRALELLAQRQARCLSRAQLRAHGVDADAERLRVRSAAWQRVGDDVVVLHSGPLGRDEHLWAAVLTSPAGALSSWTAPEVHGLRGWEREAVHLVVPAGRGRRRAPGARLSTSTRCAEVRTRRGLPVHDVARAAVDAAGSCAGPRSAGGLVAAVVQQRLTTAPRLRVELLAAGPLRHRAALRAVLHDVEAGSGSMAEVDLARLCRTAGLPVPLRQQVREDASGRRRYLDAEWLLPDGRRLLLEVDGVGHVEEGRWYDDLLRAAEVARPGEVLLRLPPAPCASTPRASSRSCAVTSRREPLHGRRDGSRRPCRGSSASELDEAGRHVLGRHPLDGDPGHRPGATAGGLVAVGGLEQGQQLLARRARALRAHLDAAVGQVAGRALQAQLQGAGARPPAEADALHLPAHVGEQPHLAAVVSGGLLAGHHRAFRGTGWQRGQR